jgi:hypothetical protein
MFFNHKPLYILGTLYQAIPTTMNVLQGHWPLLKSILLKINFL